LVVLVEGVVLVVVVGVRGWVREEAVLREFGSNGGARFDWLQEEASRCG